MKTNGLKNKCLKQMSKCVNIDKPQKHNIRGKQNSKKLDKKGHF